MISVCEHVVVAASAWNKKDEELRRKVSFLLFAPLDIVHCPSSHEKLEEIQNPFEFKIHQLIKKIVLACWSTMVRIIDMKHSY
jgi:hypothetical protein